MSQFVQGSDKLTDAIDQIDAKYNILTPTKGDKLSEEHEQMKYLFFKLVFKQAQFQRKMRQLTEAEDNCTMIIEFVKNEQKEKMPAALFWRFGIKAAYLKATMLAVQMEFSIPKQLLLEWTLPTLKTLTETFAKIDYEVPGAALKSMDMLTYRRVFAKFRRLGYYVQETEHNYKTLLYDLMKMCGCYDFTEFEENNPVSTVEEQKEAEEK